MKNNQFLLFVNLLAIMAIGAACGAVSESPLEGPAMANPASVFCEDQGGELEIRTDEIGGQYGVCMFEDGSECEEWEFFNEKCSPGDYFPTSDGGDNVGLANPAAGYCTDQSGSYEIRTQEDGGQYGMCIFTDGSECDEWQFYEGKCAQGDFFPED